MPSPFPGMDPYLEDPELWPDVHHELISRIRERLHDGLGPKYVVRVETRVYITDFDEPVPPFYVPDLRIEKKSRGAKGGGTAVSAIAVRSITEPILYPSAFGQEIEETFLTVRDDKKSVVAVIEVLSPTNKVPGSSGRRAFLKKRGEILASSAHWLEIDLLREGERTPVEVPSDRVEYRALLFRGDDRARVYCWPIRLQDPLPVLGVPLSPPDGDVPLDLGEVIAAVYQAGAYNRSVNYRKPPIPPLPRNLAGWANKLLKDKGLR
jgi:hypothetical protein